MNNNDKINNKILESIIVISIMTSYIIYGIHFLPLLIPIMPIPFIILGVRNGIETNIIGLIAVSIIVAVFFDIPSGVSILLILAPISIAMNYCIKKRKNTIETTLISFGAFLIFFILLIYLEGQVSGISIGNQMEETITEILTTQLDSFREAGMTNHDLAQWKDLLESTYNTTLALFPSLLITLSLAISYFNYLLLSRILSRMGIGISNRQLFSRFKLPNNIIPGIGVMFLTAFIFNKLELGYNNAFLLNLIFLSGFVFFVQGLAVVYFLLSRMKMKPFSRTMIIILSIIFLPVSSVMIIIGLADTIFDLRRLRRSKS